jgi:hypothetical protein
MSLAENNTVFGRFGSPVNRSMRSRMNRCQRFWNITGLVTFESFET